MWYLKKNNTSYPKALLDWSDPQSCRSYRPDAAQIDINPWWKMMDGGRWFRWFVVISLRIPQNPGWASKDVFHQAARLQVQKQKQSDEHCTCANMSNFGNFDATKRMHWSTNSKIYVISINMTLRHSKTLIFVFLQISPQMNSKIRKIYNLQTW